MPTPRLALFLSFAIACGLPAQQPAPTPPAKAAEASGEQARIAGQRATMLATARKIALYLFCAHTGCLPAQETAPRPAAKAVEASNDKLTMPEALGTKLATAKKTWTDGQEKTKAKMLAAFDAEIAKVAKTKRESEAVLHKDLVAAKERFVESGTMPAFERLRKAAGDYEVATSKARARYRAEVRKVVEELSKSNLHEIAREQLATLARECPYQTDPATFAKGMVRIRDDCRKQFAKNHPKTDVWAITHYLTGIMERCERHELSAADLPREVAELKGMIGGAKAMTRDNPNTQQLRALLKQLDEIMSPTNDEQ